MILIILLILIFSFPTQAQANDLLVSCDSQNCQLLSSTPLFSDAALVPGFPSLSHLLVSNSSPNDCQLSLTSTNSTTSSSLLSYQLQIKISQPSQEYYNSSLSSFFASSPIKLGTIPSQTTQDYLWQLILPLSVDNQLQSLSNDFDLSLSFDCQFTSLASTSTPTPTSAPSPTPTSPPDPQSNIFITEIFARSTPETSEWVEIINLNSTPFTLDGWQIGDDDGHTFTIPKVSIPAQSFYVYNFSSNVLNDTGDQVILQNPSAQIISSVSYPSLNSTVLSYSLQPNGWCFTQISTPGSANSDQCYSALQQFTPTPTSLLQGQVAGVSTDIPSSTKPSISSSQVLGEQTCRFYWIPILFLISLIFNFALFSTNLSKTFLAIIFSYLIFSLDRYIKNITCSYFPGPISDLYWLYHLLALIFPLIAKITYYGKHDSSKFQK